MPHPPRRARPVVVALLALAAGLAAGCGAEDGVRSYRAPREATGKGGPQLPAGHPPVGAGMGAGADPAAGDLRILGAIYPAGKSSWFFKLTGPADKVEKAAAGFDALARSVKLPPDGLPTFDVPEGWERTGPRDVSRGGITVRFDEVVRVGPAADKVELTVNQSSGSVAANVGRWAGQVGLADFKPADLAKYTTEFDANGVKAVRVDLHKAAAGKP